MDVLTAIEKRREITRYKQQPIAEEVMDKLIQALYLSPSGNNLPSREFILVTGREMLQQLSKTTPYMKWLSEAAAGIVITGSPAVSKYWLQDAAIAGGYLWLTAVSNGLGAAWGAVYHSEDHAESQKRENHVRELMRIPDDRRVVAVIGLGYPDIELPPKTMYPLDQVFHRETYPGTVLETGVQSELRIKRVYDAAEPGDGMRILVDRIWPRGISKEQAHIREWVKDVAPSTALRKWFGHDPKRYAEFKQRYVEELQSEAAQLYLQQLREYLRQGTVTLLYAAKDQQYNQAVVLQEYLQD